MFRNLLIILDVLNCIILVCLVGHNYFGIMHEYIRQADSITTIKLLVFASGYFCILLRLLHVYISYYQLKNLCENNCKESEEGLNK